MSELFDEGDLENDEDDGDERMEKDEKDEGTSAVPPAPAKAPLKICPLRKQKLIGEAVFGLNEIDAPCVREGCGFWDRARCNVLS